MAVIGEMKKLTVGSKTYSITVPTKTSDLTNDSGFITSYPNINLSFNAPDGINWSSLANTWTPSVSGIATTRINPSNTSNAYLVLRDSSNGNVVVAQVASTGGLGVSVSWPVIGGHTYNVGGNSTNITSMETRLYPFNIEVTV